MRDQVRAATRHLIAIMWEMGGDAERAKAVRHGRGDLRDEWNAAAAALSEDDLRRLRAACDAAFGYLRTTERGTPAEPTKG